MRIRKRAGSALFVVAAVATVVGLAATTALATSATLTVKVTKGGAYTAKSSKTNGKGQTDGLITGANTSVSMVGCSFKVTGSAPGFYTNGTHKLTLTPKLPNRPLASGRLTVSNVSGCAGLVSNGDHPTYKSIYTLSRAFVIKA